MKKQNRFMTFILSMLLALTLVLPGSAVIAKADGQGDMAVHFIDVGQDWRFLYSREEKTFFTMAETGHMRMKWYST